MQKSDVVKLFKAITSAYPGEKGFSSADMDAVFQSTPPVRGATLHYCSSDSDWLNTSWVPSSMASSSSEIS